MAGARQFPIAMPPLPGGDKDSMSAPASEMDAFIGDEAKKEAPASTLHDAYRNEGRDRLERKRAKGRMRLEAFKRGGFDAVDALDDPPPQQPEQQDEQPRVEDGQLVWGDEPDRKPEPKGGDKPMPPKVKDGPEVKRGQDAFDAMVANEKLDLILKHVMELADLRYG